MIVASWTDVWVGLGTGLVSGVLSGVATGLLVWYLVTVALAPVLELSPTLVPPDDRSRRPSIKVTNRRRGRLPNWAAIDVVVTATLRIQGVNSDRPKLWTNYAVPLSGDGRTPRLSRTTSFTLLPEQIDYAHQRRLRDLAAEHDAKQSDLRALMRLRETTKLRVLVSAAHERSRAVARVEATYLVDTPTVGNVGTTDSVVSQPATGGTDPAEHDGLGE